MITYLGPGTGKLHMNTNSEIEAIRSLIAARETAIANGEAETAIEPLAHDAVVYDLQPPLAFAGADARDAEELRAWLRTWKKTGPRVEFRESRMLIDGNICVAFGLSRMRGEKIEEGSVELWFRTTLVFKRSEGGWTIVHEHNSVPMKMDGSGLAAVDLKP
jgi:ketosteroid isomerase-like protein